MAEVHNDIQEAVGEVFDELRNDLFLDFDDELSLLKADTASNAFSEVWQIDDSWFFEYDGFNKVFRLKISDSSDDLTDAMAEATHVKINDDVYAIRRADILPPMGTNVFWKLLCDRFTDKSNYVEMW